MELESSYKSLLKRLKRNGEQRQISCEFCLKDITRCTHVHCAECRNFYVCLVCFSRGYMKSEHEHQRIHKFFIVDSCRYPLFESNWTCKEELMLLENLLKIRYGNWVLISEAMGGSKTAEECEMHYKQVYLHKSIEDLKNYKPISYRNSEGFVAQHEICNTSFFNSVKFDNNEHYMITDKRVEEKGVLSEFTGYMPLRKDFEIEYENDIENYLADLEFYDDDRPEDIEIKLKQLVVYQEVLNEREERKEFVMKRWPQEVKIEKKCRNNVFERNVYASLKPFARFLNYEKHLNFCKALSEESMLKMKLDELKEARNRGFKTEEDFKKFLLQKKGNFPNKCKEYDLLGKEGFVYKQAEAQKAEILKGVYEKQQEVDVEAEFCKVTGVGIEQFASLKEKLAASVEAKQGNGADGKIDECFKKEFIDFIVKLKSPDNN